MVWILVAQIFQVVGGEVSYWTRVRSAAGLLPHTIQAVNRDVTGTVLIQGETVQGTLYVPVVRFQSGNTSRDRDVAEILDYQTYPYITLRVQGSSNILRPILEGSVVSDTLPFTFYLTVRDCTQSYTRPVYIVRKSDTLEASVSIPTRFSALGIHPPKVKGLGFIGGLVSRADDTLLLEGSFQFLEERP